MDDTLLRIVQLMKEQNITDAEMVKYLGIPKGTFSNWRRLMGKSYYAYIDKIADRLGVSIDFLIRGHENTKENINTYALSDNEWKLICDYRRVSERCKKLIVEALQIFITNETVK